VSDEARRLATFLNECTCKVDEHQYRDLLCRDCPQCLVEGIRAAQSAARLAALEECAKGLEARRDKASANRRLAPMACDLIVINVLDEEAKVIRALAKDGAK
jgi:hypothetical protein